MDLVQQERISFKDNFFYNVPIIKVKTDFGELNFIIDSGSTMSIIDLEKLPQDIKSNLYFDSKPKGIGGTVSVSSILTLGLKINNRNLITTFRAIDLEIRNYLKGITINGILGSDFLKENKATLDYSKLELLI